MLQRITNSIASWYTPKTQDIASIVGAIAFSYFMYRFAPIYFFGLIVPLAGAFVLVGILTIAFLCLSGERFRDAIDIVRFPLTNRATDQLTEGLRNNTLTLEDLKWFLQPGILRGKAKLDNAYLLINACEHERKDLLEILLPHVTKVNLFVLTNLQGLNACHIAVAKKNIEIIKLLCRRYKELNPNSVLNLLTTEKGEIDVGGPKVFLAPLEYAAHLQLEQVYRACLEFTTPLEFEDQFLAMNNALRQNDIKRVELYDKVWGQEILEWKENNIIDIIFNETRTKNCTALIDTWINRACQKGWLSSADEYKEALNQHQESGTKDSFSITQLFKHRTTNRNNNGSSHNNENVQEFSPSTSAALH